METARQGSQSEWWTQGCSHLHTKCGDVEQQTVELLFSTIIDHHICPFVQPKRQKSCS
jgi:hypothetical protein